jgi:signal transduction histidine kinase
MGAFSVIRSSFDRNSLTFRLGFVGIVWSALTLVLAGYVMTTVQRDNIERAFDELLLAYSGLLTASFVEFTQNPDAAVQLADPRFERPGSGWYWRINTQTGETLKTSGSLFDPLPSLTDIEFDAQSVRAVTVETETGETLRMLERRIYVFSTAYFVLVTGDATAIKASVDDFRSAIIITMTVVGLALLGLFFLQMGVGMKPVSRMLQDMSRLREGKLSRLDGQYPTELLLVTNELNRLLDTNKTIIERARGHVGNLAHALKTPLSVIRNEAEGLPDAKKQVVTEQAGTMQRMVDTYLGRAQSVAQSKTITSVTQLEEVLTPLIRVMHKLYGCNGIEIKSDTDIETVTIQCEKQDLEEILGNMLENACKYGKSKVLVSIENTPSTSKNKLTLIIEDDGPGISVEEHDRVMIRGVRLDEATNGSGLGLSITKELVDLYDGSLSLGTSETLGGLKVSITLPGAT